VKPIVIALLLILTCAAFAVAEDLGGYTFLKISSEDARAVVKTPEGENRLVAVGEVLGTAKIVEITADRVVLEQADANGTAVLIVKVKDGRQQISRIQQRPVKAQTVSVEPGTASKQFGQ